MTSNPFYSNSRFFQSSRLNFPSPFDLESIFEQPRMPSLRRSNFLDLDTISIPISFEAPVYSAQSRTKSTERPIYHQPRDQRLIPAHTEQQKPLLFERTRQLYVGLSPQVNRVVAQPKNRAEDPAFSERIHQSSHNIPIDEPHRPSAQNIRFVEKPESKQPSPIPSKFSEEKIEEKLEDEEIPKFEDDEDYPDPNALIERLKLYGMKEKTAIRGDGNCQFAAFSDQYYGDVKYAAALRTKCVKWLWENKEFLLPNGAKIEHFLQTDFFPTWRDYCEYMIQDGTWGDNLTLVALSELFQTKIVIISSIKLSKNQNPCTVIIPSKWSDNKVVYLSHLHELHYSSICQDDDFTAI